MKRNYTKEAEKIVYKAAKFAMKTGNPMVGTEHLLYGLSVGPGVASAILKENNISKDKIQFEIENEVYSAGDTLLEDIQPDISPKLEELLVASDIESKKQGANKIGTEHMLMSILKDMNCMAYKILINLEANIQKIYMDIVTTIGGDAAVAKNDLIASRSKKKKKTSTPMLDRYTTDLNKLAINGKIDPVIGREEEINRVLEILSRRTKNNPCLVGEPGVGKTAIAEGLALRITEGEVPPNLIGKRVLSMNLSGMVAGAKYRGEFEERIKRLIKETETVGNVLLFIDELHTIIGAGGAEGATDASNILKPSLARGEIQVMGATTNEEYRKHVEKDAALERRFQPVQVEEPTELETIEMLRGIRDRYEKHHKIEITDEAIDAAVRLSARYISDRFLPDKAIDLMDEAAAKMQLKRAVRKSETLKKLEKKERQLYEAREEALISGDMDQVMEIRKKEKENDKKIEKETEKLEKKDQKGKYKIKENEIAQIVSRWTKIPVRQLEQEEMERLRALEDILHKRVVGQDEAVSSIAKAVRRGRVGLKDPKRPIGSFLFLGPTGVGKTELCKALAEAVFGSENDMIRVDMSEYMEMQSVSKMIGSPPGYVGYEEGGQLSEKVRKKPYSVILFDEVEKAHPDVFNILLQVLEDGHITDSSGRKVDFKNTIIIMTSNAGANRIISPKTLGFGQVQSEEENHNKMKEGVLEEAKKIFKPEFINRIDDMIVFHTLNEENIHDITAIIFDNFKNRVKDQLGIKLEIDEQVISFIAKKGFDKNYGARPIRRALQTEVEDKLAEEVLDGQIIKKDKAKIFLSDKEEIIIEKL